MAISQNNKNLLSELKAAGVDAATISNLELTFDTNGKADEVLNRSILAQKSFTEYTTKKESEIRALKEKVNELASLKGSVSSGALVGNKDLLEAAAARIAELEDVLIADGYDPEQVKATSFAKPSEIQKALV